MFWAPCSSGEGAGGWVGVWVHLGAWGVSTHAFTHMHMHTHTCIKLQMAADMEASMFSMFIMFNMHVCVCACVCVCVHVCVHGTPPTHPYPPSPPSTHLPPPGGWIPGISKNLITLALIKIFQFCLKIWNLWKISHPWVGVWFGGWVGGWVDWWVGSGQNTKNLKNIDWIEIIQFCLNIYDLYTHPHPHSHPWVGGWVGQWVNGWDQVKWLTIE